jgi:hypothetical protein
MVRVMVFNATFTNISVISLRSSFIGGGNRSTGRKPQTCLKSLTIKKNLPPVIVMEHILFDLYLTFI